MNKNNKNKQKSKKIKLEKGSNQTPNMSVNICRVNGNGYQIPRSLGKEKYFDVTNSGAVLSSGIVNPLSDVTQALTISGRTGDNMTITRIFVNYSWNSATADVFATTRVLIVQWIPNTQFAGTPTAAVLLQSSSAVDAMYNFQYSNQFRVLYDAVHFLSGTATAPTASTNIGYYGEIGRRKFAPNVSFAPGAITGSNKIYCLLITDSAVAPSPSYTMQSRVTFLDD